MRPRAQTCFGIPHPEEPRSGVSKDGKQSTLRDACCACSFRVRAAGKDNVFDNLSEKLGGILDRLTRRGSLTEADVDAAMREVRRALLEADVSLDVVRSFTEKVREQAIGATVVKSVTPGQMVVKIVHDELIATLGSDGQTIDLNAVPPVAIMMVGL